MNDLDVDIRIRYSECDPQSMAHHSAFPVWMEFARTELLRESGLSYRECEEKGVYFVVLKLSIKYRAPAFFDDLIKVHVESKANGRVRIDHAYTFLRGETVLSEAESTLACVDKNGRPQRIPDGLFPTPSNSEP